MAKYELSKDWIQKNGIKIKEAYNIALADRYDIKSKEDVLKILQIVDSENATYGNAKIFSGVLQLFSQQLKKRFEPKKKIKGKIVN